jgi:hypothetical protein
MAKLAKSGHPQIGWDSISHITQSCGSLPQSAMTKQTRTSLYLHKEAHMILNHVGNVDEQIHAL